MARKPRLDLVGVPQHIIQRGNNRDICFVANDDYAAYAHWLQEGSQKYDVAVHAWVFMTNHVHLLATPTVKGAVSKMMQSIGRRYVQLA
jgi:putative transposase